MTAYFVRRFLLIIPTFIGITLAVFAVMHFVPGGPVERQIMRLQMAAMTEGGGDGGGAATMAGSQGASALPQEAVDEIKRYYGFDKPVHIRYAQWLWKVLHLDLGQSYVYQDPVWDVIKSRFPVSIFLGLTGFLLSYLVCVPLGVMKAVRHGSTFDVVSSALVFLGYSVPGWALGTALLVLFGGGSFWEVFPLGGFRPDNWEYLTFWGKVSGQIEHMFLPVLAYMVGSFATQTILTKNSLMESLGQDYVRTAFAKGLSERRVIFVHALRNSLIPIVTGLGHVFSLVLAGSFLIERVFNIDGMGYLGYTALLQRDYPVALGILVIGSMLMLIGNILSDALYAVVDPRIRFK
ncbi:MAG: ABC transporter permease subunit [Vicinamibacterales bacterium]